MPEPSIVVQAKSGSAAACNHDVNVGLRIPIYSVKEGEQGLLHLKNTEGKLWTRGTYVLWDRDPDQQPRKVILDEVQIVGIEVEGQRMTLQSK